MPGKVIAEWCQRTDTAAPPLAPTDTPPLPEAFPEQEMVAKRKAVTAAIVRRDFRFFFIAVFLIAGTVPNT